MKAFLRSLIWFFWPTLPELKRRQDGDVKPELSGTRTYRGYEYKIWVTEQTDELYYSYRRDGYIPLEVHVSYPDGSGSYTTSSQDSVQKQIKSFVKQAEVYIDRMIAEASVRNKMECDIKDALK